MITHAKIVAKAMAKAAAVTALAALSAWFVACFALWELLPLYAEGKAAVIFRMLEAVVFVVCSVAFYISDKDDYERQQKTRP